MLNIIFFGCGRKYKNIEITIIPCVKNNVKKLEVIKKYVIMIVSPKRTCFGTPNAQPQISFIVSTTKNGIIIMPKYPMLKNASLNKPLFAIIL